MQLDSNTVMRLAKRSIVVIHTEFNFFYIDLTFLWNTPQDDVRCGPDAEHLYLQIHFYYYEPFRAWLHEQG